MQGIYRFWRHAVVVAGFSALGCVCVGLFSCQGGGQRQVVSSDTLLAEVGNRQLYRQDLPPMSQDSGQMLRAHAEAWILEQLLADEAQKQDAILDLEALEERVAAYRRTLLRHRLESAYLKTHLSTAIHPSVVTAYYEQHSDQFMLAEDIIRFLYLKLPQGITNLQKFRNILRRNPLGETTMIEEYCKQNVELCIISDKTWTPVDKLLAQLPLRARERLSRQIGQMHYFQSQDNDYHHLVHILENRPIGTRPPQRYIEKKIEHNILSERKKKLIEELHKIILDEAKRKQAFRLHL